jgi:ABC-type Fe3+-hydroxamate transport system substrate-binding protein
MRPKVAAVRMVLLLALAACGQESGRDVPDARARSVGDTVGAAVASATDDFGQPLPADASFAARVVSLNPAFTEIAFAIGAGDRMVGRTAWDDRPAAALAVTDVGAGIRPNVEAVLATKPTLVLLYATAENRAAADALARAGVRTLALRTVTIADFRRASRVLGVALGAASQATALVDSIDVTLGAVREAVRDVTRPRVVWPSWDAPVMVVGNASYEAELLELAGAENVFADREEPVATVTVEEIARRDPSLLLAGPDRATRLRESATWRAVPAVRDGRIVVLDTAVIGRPGVTIGMAAVSIARALHPDRADRLP